MKTITLPITCKKLSYLLGILLTGIILILFFTRPNVTEPNFVIHNTLWITMAIVLGIIGLVLLGEKISEKLKIRCKCDSQSSTKVGN